MKDNKNINNKKKLKLGIQLLRIFFSFHILVFHCINHEKYKSKYIQFIINKVDIDLCTFFIISFYLSYNLFTSKNIIKIKHRFKRLLIPYIVWPIIFFITCINKISIDKIKYLFYQLLIGNGIHSVFWFQFNIIFISLIFSIIIFLSKKRFFFYLFLIGIICYLFVIYSNNTNFFSKFNYIVVFPLRPIASSFIYSLMGFFLFLIKIEKLKLKKYKIKTIFICLLFLSLYPYYKRKFENDSYFLMIINSLGSISLLIPFLIVPFEKLNNSLLIRVFTILATYSGGIYYLHTKVQYYLDSLSEKMKSRTILVCIINYILCNCICLIGLKLFRNSNIIYLFI